MNSTYDVHMHGDTTIVDVIGDLDFSNADMFAMIAGLSQRPLERLIISYERCTFCDAAGLTMLVRAYKTMHGALSVVLPNNSRCRRVFDVTGLAKFLPIVPTLEAALRFKTVAA